MSKDTQTIGRADVGDTAVTGPVLQASAAAPFEAMLADVPEADAGGYERILASLATAKSLEDLEAPWRAQGADAYLGEWLSIRGIHKMPSDYQTGLPWFLVVDAASRETGEAVTFTTGSVNIVAQLVRAHALGLFPLVAKIVESDRVTAAGFRPQRLVFSE